VTQSDGTDLGLTHVALTCTDGARTIEFYRRYGGLTVIHDRLDDGVRVFWLSDLKRPFGIVFLESPAPDARLGPFGHLGVCVESRAEVDRLVAQAQAEGHETRGPTDTGPPVGYWAFIQDPDGHTLEVSYGQELKLRVEEAASGGEAT
jgi:catechol 2,3-dioxygenase-like lactoylglutathione lyase family enzyme